LRYGLFSVDRFARMIREFAPADGRAHLSSDRRKIHGDGKVTTRISVNAILCERFDVLADREIGGTRCQNGAEGALILTSSCGQADPPLEVQSRLRFGVRRFLRRF
jgi:hypothetical protein